MNARRTLALALGLSLLLASCGSTGGKDRKAKRAASDEKRVAVTDLPPKAREVIDSFRAGGGEWEVMRERVRADPVLARFVVDNMFDQLVRSYSGAELARPDQVKGPFERAQDELVALGEHSTPLLVEMLEAEFSDGVVAYLASDTLARIGPAAAPAIADKLRSRRPETRRRAIEALVRAAPPADEPLASGSWKGRRPLEVLGHLVARDEDWVVRGTAAEGLGALAAGAADKLPARKVLEGALADVDPLVWSAAARGLARLGDLRAIPALADGLARAADAGRLGEVRAIEKALRNLTGGRGPASPSTAAWKAWYEANRGS